MMTQSRRTKPFPGQRLTRAGVICLCGLVVVLAVLQITGIIDRMNMLITVFFLMVICVGISASLGWLPWRYRR
ncbi:hypothetical protein ACOQFL_08490 [Actinopolyspora sp. H202]|uniref:hypothetical protein n=1 Tax=Actinopolyspora sp. H202 TaxID=1500456 RepID=UPI003EE67324